MKNKLNNRGSPTNPYGWVKWFLWTKFRIAVGWPGNTGTINGARLRINYWELMSLKIIWENEMPSYIMVNYLVSLNEKDTIVPLGLIGSEDDKLFIYMRDFSFLFPHVGELPQKTLRHYEIQIVEIVKSMLERKQKPFAIYRKLAGQYQWNFFVSPIVINQKPLPVIVAECVPEAELIYEFEIST